MQDVRSQAIAAGGGSGFFDSSGDRRLRPHLHQNHQALKCPRCDSLNTKFCYFNNYNLSQPRHFCKSCRRYWTKGGVLRNVPVGGGCRKSNRSAKLKTSASDRKSNSHSSSDASSLTGTAATPEATSVSSSNSGSNLMNHHPNSAAFFEFPPLIDTSSDDRIFPDPHLLGFKFSESEFPAYRMQNHESSGSFLYDHNFDRQLLQEEGEKMEDPITSDELKMADMDKEVVLQTDLLGMNSRRSNNNGDGDGDGVVELDWTAGEDEELFDLTAAAASVDQCYWTQQWP